MNKNTDAETAAEGDKSALNNLVSRDALEKRLQNTERALLALWTLLEDTVPPAYADDINNMMNQYFDANKKLGCDFDTMGFDDG